MKVILPGSLVDWIYFGEERKPQKWEHKPGCAIHPEAKVTGQISIYDYPRLRKSRIGSTTYVPTT